MRAPFLVVVIVILHVLVAGGVLFIQGCGTTHQDAPEPPPVPVMPPSEQPASVRPEPAGRFTPPEPVRDTAPVAQDIKTYTVKSGDILSRIANKFGVSVRELSELNGITNPNMIRVGQELVLPAYAKKPKASSDEGTAPSSSRPASQKQAPDVEPGEIYEVASGDVLSRIAVRHDTTVKAIMELNNLDSTKIIVGQKLRMPGGVAVEAEKPETSNESDLEAELDALETQSEPEGVEIEQEVEVKEIETAEPPQEDTGVASLFSSREPYKYTVAEGETVMQIAKDYIVDPHELRELNNLGKDEEVKPGQQILIPMSDL